MTRGAGRLLRVAIVTHSITAGGGVAVLASDLYQVLAASDRYVPEVVSLATSADDPMSRSLRKHRTWLHAPTSQSGEWNGIPFVHVGANLTEIEFQRYRPRRVLDALLKQYDLVHVVAGIPPWALVAANCRQPVVLQVATRTALERSALLKTGSKAKGAWTRLMTRVSAGLERRALGRCEVVFVINHGMRRYVADLIGADRVHLVLPGIDTNAYRPSSSPGDGYILSVGRFSDPRKNITLLLEAYRRLRVAIPAAPRLLIAGQRVGTAAHRVAAEAAGIADAVMFRADVPPADLPGLYRGAAFFVLSSDEEGLGIVILEAMASGLAVVSTQCGGPETVIVDGQTGYLTPVGDADALARRMQQLAEAPLVRQCLGRAGRAVALERFSADIAGRAFIEQYDRLSTRSFVAPLGGSRR